MGHADEGDEINLTPMLDVVFIMLIFFIVTASFVKEAGYKVCYDADNIIGHISVVVNK